MSQARVDFILIDFTGFFKASIGRFVMVIEASVLYHMNEPT